MRIIVSETPQYSRYGNSNHVDFITKLLFFLCLLSKTVQDTSSTVQLILSNSAFHCEKKRKKLSKYKYLSLLLHLSAIHGSLIRVSMSFFESGDKGWYNETVVVGIDLESAIRTDPRFLLAKGKTNAC